MEKRSSHDSGSARTLAAATRLIIAVGVLLVLVVGCTDTQPMRTGGANDPSVASVGAPRPADDSDSSGPPHDTSTATPADLQELSQLWQRRTGQALENQDYPIGPGDVLEVSVPDIDELRQRKVRVSTQGIIELPLLGNVQAGGLTEAELQDELDQKLEKYMYHPECSIFVEQYHNRQAAVIGAVMHPGLVLLESPSETVLDVLSQAGGLTNTAADEIILIPAEQGDPEMAQRLSSVAADDQTIAASDSPANSTDANDSSSSRGPYRMRSQGEPMAPGNAGLSLKSQRVQEEAKNDVASSALKMLPTNARPVSIPVRSTTLTGAGRYVNLPVRPGDVIVVPGGGDVMVVGWVEQPGYFQVGSGLTVLGAIGAAGGPMYAADTHDVTLIRSNAAGTKTAIRVDMDKITHGEEADIPVKANDVIDVPYSDLRIGPYVFYSIISKFGVGAAAIPY
jgi:protein involved in polysaccharide export with SLBB domain